MPTLATLAAVFTELGTSGSTFCGATGSTARAGPKAAASAIAIAESLKLQCRFIRHLPFRSAPECPFVGHVARIIRAVDVGVAIHAAARERVGAGARACERGDIAPVARRLVARLAEH